MLSLQRAAHLVREGQGNPANITWELWNERRKVSNIHRKSPLQDSRVVGSAGNGSGTAEVGSFVSHGEAEDFLFFVGCAVFGRMISAPTGLNGKFTVFCRGRALTGPQVMALIRLAVLGTFPQGKAKKGSPQGEAKRKSYYIF